MRYSPHAKYPKRPRDWNQLAKFILGTTTGECLNDLPKGPESATIQARRKGGLKGGKAQGAKLSSVKCRMIATKADGRGEVVALRWIDDALRTPGTAFSKKVDHHKAMIALHYMHYNSQVAPGWQWGFSRS